MYYFATCPYCIFVRLALWRYRLDVPLKDIIFHPRNNADLVSGWGTIGLLGVTGVTLHKKRKR